MEGEVWVLVPLTFAILFGFIAWVVGHTMRDRAVTRSREQIHSKMIDRFSASDDFIRFMQTPEGSKYLESFTERPRARPAEKVIAAVQTGVILVMISCGFIVAAALIGHGRIVDSAPFIIGILGFFLGMGFLLSGLVSHRLSKSLGILSGEEPAGRSSRE